MLHLCASIFIMMCDPLQIITDTWTPADLTHMAEVWVENRNLLIVAAPAVWTNVWKGLIATRKHLWPRV